MTEIKYYQCELCKKIYSTPEEADNCFKNDSPPSAEWHPAYLVPRNSRVCEVETEDGKLHLSVYKCWYVRDYDSDNYGTNTAWVKLYPYSDDMRIYSDGKGNPPVLTTNAYYTRLRGVVKWRFSPKYYKLRS